MISPVSAVADAIRLRTEEFLKTLGTAVSAKPIVMRAEYAFCPNLTIIDTPGFVLKVQLHFSPDTTCLTQIPTWSYMKCMSHLQIIFVVAFYGYVALLCALPIPQRMLNMELKLGLSHLVSNCNESRRLSYQVAELEVRCTTSTRSK